jgi:hypothetical protein
MVRIVIRGQSFVDGQEVPFLLVHDVDPYDLAMNRAARDVSAWLEECDFKHPTAAILGTLTVEVQQLCRVQ